MTEPDAGQQARVHALGWSMTMMCLMTNIATLFFFSCMCVCVVSACPASSAWAGRADIDAATGDHGSTPLHVAAISGFDEVGYHHG